jgi:hypothetical protein
LPFVIFLLRSHDGDNKGPPSRITRAPLPPLVGGGGVGSFLTLLGIVGGGPDLQEWDADLDADPDDDDAIRHGIHELPCRRDTEGAAAGGGIPNTG